MHIQINLVSKLQLKLIILTLWTKFARKGYFRLKTKKSHSCLHPRMLLTMLNFSATTADRRKFKINLEDKPLFHLLLLLSRSVAVKNVWQDTNGDDNDNDGKRTFQTTACHDWTIYPLKDVVAISNFILPFASLQSDFIDVIEICTTNWKVC